MANWFAAILLVSLLALGCAAEPNSTAKVVAVSQECADLYGSTCVGMDECWRLICKYSYYGPPDVAFIAVDVYDCPMVAGRSSALVPGNNRPIALLSPCNQTCYARFRALLYPKDCSNIICNYL